MTGAPGIHPRGPRGTRGRLQGRYSTRRRVNRVDRNGDPLDGLVNLFDVAIVLAVAFLLAALTAAGLPELLTGGDLTIVKSQGDKTQLIIKEGGQIKTLELDPADKASGVGRLIGQFYQLEDGSTIYVPADGTPSTP
jgi:hypothetical protein